ncbi:MAG: leucine dehydrogenase, partial [Longimicrobiales bacterium]
KVLCERGIVYVPDYVANAGGVINGAGREISAWPVDRALRAVDGIYDTSLTVLELARAEDIPASLAADRIAERRLHG